MTAGRVLSQPLIGITRGGASTKPRPAGDSSPARELPMCPPSRQSTGPSIATVLLMSRRRSDHPRTMSAVTSLDDAR